MDLIEDAGKSMSPYVDIGQVEGSYVMGVGLFTTEFLQYDADTGKKLVTGTWVRIHLINSYACLEIINFHETKRFEDVIMNKSVL